MSGSLTPKTAEGYLARLVKFAGKYIYWILGVGTLVSYFVSLKLIAIQSPWVNVIVGKASVSIILLLVMWVIFVERIGKKRKWTGRKMMVMQLAGVGVLAMVVKYTPI